MENKKVNYKVHRLTVENPEEGLDLVEVFNGEDSLDTIENNLIEGIKGSIKHIKQQLTEGEQGDDIKLYGSIITPLIFVNAAKEGDEGTFPLIFDKDESPVK